MVEHNGCVYAHGFGLVWLSYVSTVKHSCCMVSCNKCDACVHVWFGNVLFVLHQDTLCFECLIDQVLQHKACGSCLLSSLLYISLHMEKQMGKRWRRPALPHTGATQHSAAPALPRAAYTMPISTSPQGARNARWPCERHGRLNGFGGYTSAGAWAMGRAVAQLAEVEL
jgi:hypothetical protein